MQTLLHFPLQADTCYLDVEDGIGLLPCQPFINLKAQANAMVILKPCCCVDIVRGRPNSRAALLEQRAGHPPFWQSITLRNSVGRYMTTMQCI